VAICMAIQTPARSAASRTCPGPSSLRKNSSARPRRACASRARVFRWACLQLPIRFRSALRRRGGGGGGAGRGRIAAWQYCGAAGRRGAAEAPFRARRSRRRGGGSGGRPWPGRCRCARRRLQSGSSLGQSPPPAVSRRRMTFDILAQHGDEVAVEGTGFGCFLHQLIDDFHSSPAHPASSCNRVGCLVGGPSLLDPVLPERILPVSSNRARSRGCTGRPPRADVGSMMLSGLATSRPLVIVLPGHRIDQRFPFARFAKSEPMP